MIRSTVFCEMKIHVKARLKQFDKQQNPSFNFRKSQFGLGFATHFSHTHRSVYNLQIAVLNWQKCEAHIACLWSKLLSSFIFLF